MKKSEISETDYDKYLSIINDYGNSDIVYMDKLSTKTSRKKLLQQIYRDLGLDASNQAKTKTICRQYEAASEMWANIMSAEVCGGESLEYVKKYLPNSYQAMLDILKG